MGREKVKKEGLSDKISFAREDCTSLSFADNDFDAITVAFGIRNFEDPVSYTHLQIRVKPICLKRMVIGMPMNGLPIG